MRNSDDWGRRLIIGVVFFAATAALCVDAEGQNQRSRQPGGASNRTATKSASQAKPNEKTETKAAAPSKKEPDKAATVKKQTALSADKKTTTLKKETIAAIENSDGEKLTTSEIEEDEGLSAAFQATEDEKEIGQDEQRYSSKPLDLTATRLPSGYCGHDFDMITRRVGDIFANKNVKKDEYEKTVDFKERIATFKAELPDQELYGELKFSSSLAMALTPSEELLGVKSSYDADAEMFRITFNDSVDYRVYLIGDSRLYGIRFKESVTSAETYVAKNGFGVEKEVEKNRYLSRGVVYTDNYNIALNDGDSLRLKGVAPSEAKKIGDSLAVLCVFQLFCVDEIESGVATPSCAVNGIWSCEPTMSDPYDFVELQIAARVSIPEFWVYNIETGDVYAKYSLKDLKTGKAKEIGDLNIEKEEENNEKEIEVAETAEEKAERVAREAAENLAKERRRAAEFWENGNKRLDNRLAAVKRLTSSREIAAPLQIAVPGDCATLAEALDEAAKAPYDGPIPRIVLDAGEYDASGLTLKTFVDVQSASGKPEDVVLTVDAASPITVDGETVASFDGVTLRQVGGGAKSGACVEVKRGIALFYGCVFDGKKGAKSATGVKAVGLKSAAVCQKCVATGFSLSALHVEDGAFGWAVESVFGPKNRFGASSKAARLEAEKCEFRGNETALYFRGIATGGAQECVYAENKRDAQILDGAKVEVDAPNVDAEK